jgi:hypothetical protein
MSKETVEIAMSALVKKHIVIPDNRRIDIELPPDTPVGEAIITVTVEPGKSGEKRMNRLGELYGSGRGESWMADDFDAPLDDFKEYM